MVKSFPPHSLIRRVCGIGILFHIKKKYLPLAAVGGFLSWLVFLLGKEFWGNVFLPTLMAGFVTDVYAEILARICKETSTSFFCYFRNPSDSRKYSLLLYEQHCGRKYCSGIGIWTGHFSFCVWNCGGNEYCVVDLLFSEKCEEKTELTWKEIPGEMTYIRFVP